MRKRLFTFIPLLIFFVGFSLILYPTISNWWNTYHQSRAIVQYAGKASGMDKAQKKEMWENAVSYNQELAKKAPHWLLTGKEWAEYKSQLDVTGTGVMGYVEIPKINCSLPIYHGTEEAVLSAGIGHIEGSSLPVGGENTHTVLSGHRGLPSAKLLTDLDRMKKGDMFYLHVLDETLAYRVDQIKTVEPDDLEELEIQDHQDLCTLVTCTPYGINSHRLLVRGHREALLEDPANETMQKMDKPNPSIWRLAVKIGLLPVLFVTAIFIARIIHRERNKNAQTKKLRRK